MPHGQEEEEEAREEGKEEAAEREEGNPDDRIEGAGEDGGREAADANDNYLREDSPEAVGERAGEGSEVRGESEEAVHERGGGGGSGNGDEDGRDREEEGKDGGVVRDEDEEIEAGDEGGEEARSQRKGGRKRRRAEMPLSGGDREENDGVEVPSGAMPSLEQSSSAKNRGDVGQGRIDCTLPRSSNTFCGLPPGNPWSWEHFGDFLPPSEPPAPTPKREPGT